ncbi:MAG: HNH endonuclease [Pseudooceanicola sp.]
MANAVFIQNPHSIYKDEPGVTYHFPHRYLGRVQETVGDWVILYEGKSGLMGYTSVQKIKGVVPDNEQEGHYYAIVEPGSLLQFEAAVPRNDPSGIAYESMLRSSDGRAGSGGANVSAVRRISPGEFSAIVNAGLRESEGPNAMPRTDQAPMPGFAEAQEAFGAAPLADVRDTILSRRAARDPIFQRLVKSAYDGRCAISGLSLRNGGGRPEVQAAHIRPVKADGPDIVQNGIALSGTLHWMFDRGLITVAEDHSIIVSHNKVDKETADRLLHPGQKLILPKNPRDHPHPDFLQYHRENVFGQGI